jgi:hypothetical protein
MRLALVTAVALAAVVSGMPAADGMSAKVDVCHVDEFGDYELIRVNERAVDRLLARGDSLPGDAVPGMPGFEFDADCVPVSIETVFAVAFSNLDDQPGYDPTGDDVLIAKWVDGPVGAPDGLIGAGDVIVVNQLPTSFDASTSSGVGLGEHVLARVLNSRSGYLSGRTAGDQLFEFSDGTGVFVPRQQYLEVDGSGAQQARIEDGPDGNLIFIQAGSPSSPLDLANLIEADGGVDDAFLDVVITLP